jgi:hypothetical protein
VLCASTSLAGSINERAVVHRLRHSGCASITLARRCHALCALLNQPCAVCAPAGSINERQWYTDYAKMSFSALLFYGYVFVLGLVLYFALRWFK